MKLVMAQRPQGRECPEPWWPLAAMQSRKYRPHTSPQQDRMCLEVPTPLCVHQNDECVGAILAPILSCAGANVAQLVECLPSMHCALGLISVISILKSPIVGFSAEAVSLIRLS